MVDRLGIAKQYMREQLAERDDIIGVMVAGSVARGEDVDGSDIDLGFYTANNTGEPRRSLSTWREGVFIESGLTSIEGWSDLEKVMKNPFIASNLNSALILHDPTEALSKIQGQVCNRNG